MTLRFLDRCIYLQLLPLSHTLQVDLPFQFLVGTITGGLADRAVTDRSPDDSEMKANVHLQLKSILLYLPIVLNQRLQLIFITKS